MAFHHGSSSVKSVKTIVVKSVKNRSILKIEGFTSSLSKSLIFFSEVMAAGPEIPFVNPTVEKFIVIVNYQQILHAFFYEDIPGIRELFSDKTGSDVHVDNLGRLMFYDTVTPKTIRDVFTQLRDEMINDEVPPNRRPNNPPPAGVHLPFMHAELTKAPVFSNHGWLLEQLGYRNNQGMLDYMAAELESEVEFLPGPPGRLLCMGNVQYKQLCQVVQSLRKFRVSNIVPLQLELED